MTDLRLLPVEPDPFLHLTHMPELRAQHIDKRTVVLTAATVDAVREVSALLREQGFRLLPGALDGIARKFDEAAPQCTCGGTSTCTVCVLAELEAERYGE